MSNQRNGQQKGGKEKSEKHRLQRLYLGIQMGKIGLKILIILFNKIYVNKDCLRNFLDIVILEFPKNN